MGELINMNIQTEIYIEIIFNTLINKIYLVYIIHEIQILIFLIQILFLLELLCNSK